MKRTFFFLGLFFLTSITFAQTETEVQDYVDHFLSAIGTFSPDPVMAGLLGATPRLTEVIMIKKCQKNIFDIGEEMDTTPSPSRVNELDDLYTRNNAILQAISGNTNPLLEFNDYKKKMIAERIKQREKKLKEEEKDNRDFWLDIFKKEINELKTIGNQIMSSGFENFNNTEKTLWDVNFLLRQNKNSKDLIKAYETMIPVLVDEGKGICDKAVKLQRKMLELSKILNEGEAIINAKIDLLKTRAANCQTIKDGIFVKTSYQEAKEVFAVSKKAKEGAFNYYIDIKIHFEHIKKINAKLDLAYTNVKNYPFVVTDKEWYEKINNLLKPIPQYLDQLKLGLEKAKAYPNKKQNLKVKIEKNKKYYSKLFPKSEVKFNRLISEVESIKIINYVVDPAALSELRDKYNNMEQAVLYSSSNRETKQPYKFKHQSINCFPIKSSKEEMDKIEAVFLENFL